jgi:hypothetical protein
MYEKELFANFELDNSSWKRTMSKLLVGSLAFNIILFLSLIYIPAVRDAFYVAALFSDAPTGWTNKDYEKTEIETATVFKLPPVDQLQYPEGYFELANGEALPPDFIAQTTPYQPEIISTNNNFPASDFPIPGFENPLPTPTPAPPVYTPPPAPSRPTGDSILPKLPRTKGKLPKFEDVAKNKEETVTPQPSPTAQTEPTKDATAKASPSPTPEEGGINQKPFKDVGFKAAKLINEKKLDLNQAVDIVITGQLNKDGKLENPKRDPRSTGDPIMQEMITEFVAAMNDSGMLKYIKMLSDGTSKRDITFRIAKDEKNVTIQLSSVVGTEAEARSKASGLNFIIGSYKSSRQGTEEGELLDKVQFTSDKGQVLINWSMPTADAMQKIQKKLAELPKDQQPQSTSQTNNTNAQAVK